MALPSAIILRGTRAGQPAAAAVAAGSLYCVTDEGRILERSTGAAWESYSSAAGAGDVTASGTLTASRLMVGAGTTIISALGSLGTTTTLLHGNAAGAPTFGAVSLTADVSGTLPVANGGTNVASYTVGDTLYASGATTLTKLAIGTAGQVLTVNGGATAPAWAAASGGTNFGFTAPVTGDFSWINQGGAAVSAASVWGTTANYLTVPASAGDNIRLRVKSAPAAPYTITAAFIASFPIANYFMAGLAWREVATGEIFLIGPNIDGSFNQANGYKAASATAVPAVQAMTIPNFAMAAPWIYWLRLVDDNTDRKVSWSADGINWLQIFSEARTTFLTPDQVGWGGYISNASFGFQQTLLSWAQT